MNRYDYARLASMPGTTTEVLLWPSKLTVRIRNQIIRNLEAGYMKGGWSSKSRHLTEAIARHYELPLLHQDNWSMRGPGKPHPDLVKPINEALLATNADLRLRGEYNRHHGDWTTYYKLQQLSDGSWYARVGQQFTHIVADAQKVIIATNGYKEKAAAAIAAMRGFDSIRLLDHEDDSAR
jgi:hypothetical protein